MTFHLGANETWHGFNDYMLGTYPTGIRKYASNNTSGYPVYASCINFRPEWSTTEILVAPPKAAETNLNYDEPRVDDDYYSGRKGICLGNNLSNENAVAAIGNSGVINDTRFFIRSMGNNSSNLYSFQIANKSGTCLFDLTPV